MPTVGEIRKVCDIPGRADKGIKNRYIWHACEGCGKERWVFFIHKGPTSLRCRSCSCKRNIKEKNNHWGGGLTHFITGYTGVRVYPGDLFYPMAGKAGYVLEHRLVMAKHLNRCLLPWEIVHHKNGARDDNRLENLRLIKCHADHLPSTHITKQLHKQLKQIETLKIRITLLEAELILLKKGQPVDLTAI
jgi:hypothetical protein